jgi:hypothetical protein
MLPGQLFAIAVKTLFNENFCSDRTLVYTACVVLANSTCDADLVSVHLVAATSVSDCWSYDRTCL